ncbi:MAG: hypothetical protein E5X13_31910, partial [Mesorhizobium sp.]
MSPSPLRRNPLRSRRPAKFRRAASTSSGDPATLRRIQNGIRDLVGLGFSVLLDMHPSGELVAAFRNDPEAAAGRVLQAWTALRAVVADLPAEWVYPELLNEPPMERSAWLALRERIAA